MRNVPAVLGVGVVLAVVAALLTAAPVGAAQNATTSSSSGAVTKRGTVVLRNLPSGRGVSRGTSPLDAELEKDAAANAGSLPVPSPPNTPVAGTEVRTGFEGLTALDQATAGGGSQFDLEPPDQGLCVGRSGGSTFVVESVNTALNVYDSATRQRLLGPITLSAFYGLAPEIDPVTGKFGPFLSDPKCYFDPDTKRWFHSVLEIGVNPDTGAFTNQAATLLAVSQTSEPRDGYFLYSIDATDASHPHCPCFGDQPLIGADKHGFYVSTAEYDLAPFGAFFNGPQLYATSKTALESGSPGPLVHFDNLTDQSGTLQPATSPGGVYETGNGGTEYLVSGRDTLPPDGHLRPGQVDELTTWALTNTSSLATAAPALSLLRTDIKTEVYGQPVPMEQRSGPRPLGRANNEPTPKLTANDERVNQVVFAAGRLWTGVNTIVSGPRTGIAWFIIKPKVAGGALSASVSKQGYLAVADGNVAFPSIGVNTAGNGVVAFTLVGRRYFPSAAYSLIDTSGTTGPIHPARFGFRPEDGFTCYASLGFGPDCRWGDYSASVAGPDGRIWSGTEYIGDNPRDLNTNWSTFIWPVRP